MQPTKREKKHITDLNVLSTYYFYVVNNGEQRDVDTLMLFMKRVAVIKYNFCCCIIFEFEKYKKKYIFIYITVSSS